MFGLGQQYSIFFSFPQSILISLPKKKRRGLGFVLLTYIREEELYNLGGRDRGRVFYCEWKMSAPLTSLVLEYITSLRCSRDSLPGTVVSHSFNKSALSTHICPDGMRRNVPLRPHWRLFLSFWGPHVPLSSTVTCHRCLPALSFLPPLAEREVCELILFHAQTFSFEFFFNSVFQNIGYSEWGIWIVPAWTF